MGSGGSLGGALLLQIPIPGRARERPACTSIGSRDGGVGSL